MARYVDIELVMKNIQQLRGRTCSYSDGIVDDVEMMMDMAPDAEVIPIPKRTTNGDMINALFPNAKEIRVDGGYPLNYIIEGEWHRNLKEWWDAPYSSESEE